MTTRVLGIDPGVASCGWASVRFTAGQKPYCEASGVWTTTAADGDTTQRVAAIGRLFANTLLMGIDLVAIEAWTFQGPNRTHATATTIPRVIERLLVLSEMKAVLAVQVTQQAAKSALGCRDKKSVRRAIDIMVDHCHAVKSQHSADAIAVAIAAERQRRVTGAIKRALGAQTCH